MEEKRPLLKTECIKMLPVRDRASFFSRSDNELFRYLITKYKNILFCAKTDTATKREKQITWLSILEEFNMAAEQPRSMKKLKFKFHNTKTKARKVCKNSNDEKVTKSSQSPACCNDIKWMQSILTTAAVEPFSDDVDDDFCIDNHRSREQDEPHIEVVQYLKELKVENDVVEVPVTIDEGKNEECVNTVVKETNETARPHFENEIPVPKKACLPIPPVQAEKPKHYEKKIYKLRARHMQEQRNEEHELFQLKKKKLLMEINLLFK